MIIDRKKAVIEYHATLGERLEDQLKVVEWARAEQKKILEEKGECLLKELIEDDTVHIKSTKGIAFLYYHASFVLYCFQNYLQRYRNCLFW